jgi:hypothetical protein
MSQEPKKDLGKQIRETEVKNILKKLREGKTLTARESAIAQDFAKEKELEAKRPSVQKRGAQFGLTRAQMYHLKEQGCDIWDDESVKKYRDLQRLRARPDATSGNESGAVMTIEDIDAIINNPAADYAQIRTAEKRLQSLIASQKLRREMAESFSADEVKARDTAIGAAMRMAVMRIETDLPGQCEGLTSSKMKPIMRAFATAILNDLADAQSPFWADVEKVKDAAKNKKR